MLIVALVLAVIALAALVTAVVTSNEVVAWVCIGASALGVLLLIIDAIRDRKNRRLDALAAAGAGATTAVVAKSAKAAPVAPVVEGPEDAELEQLELDEVNEYLPEGEPVFEPEPAVQEWETVAAEAIIEDYPDEIVHDEPEFDTYSDDEPEFPATAEEAAIHIESPDYGSDEAVLEAEPGDEVLVEPGDEVLVLEEDTVLDDSAIVRDDTPATPDTTVVVYTSSDTADSTTVYVVNDERS